ncbi:MAG: hypothetical protein M1820_004992 [Bogoriella megaspora]|nr:MAG: hypothetical protein M1820_004992 [Bogoriella megaspora]
MRHLGSPTGASKYWKWPYPIDDEDADIYALIDTSKRMYQDVMPTICRTCSVRVELRPVIPQGGNSTCLRLRPIPFARALSLTVTIDYDALNHDQLRDDDPDGLKDLLTQIWCLVEILRPYTGLPPITISLMDRSYLDYLTYPYQEGDAYWTKRVWGDLLVDRIRPYRIIVGLIDDNNSSEHWDRTLVEKVLLPFFELSSCRSATITRLKQIDDISDLQENTVHLYEEADDAPISSGKLVTKFSRQHLFGLREMVQLFEQLEHSLVSQSNM